MERGRGSDWLLQGHERPEATRLTASLGCGLVGQTLEPEEGGPGPETMADGPLNSVTAPRSMELLFPANADWDVLVRSNTAAPL